MTIKQLHLGYRSHDGELWRLWRSDWFGDQFNIITQAELITLQAAVRDLIPMIDYDMLEGDIPVIDYDVLEGDEQ
jgi:hypothetical protein